MTDWLGNVRLPPESLRDLSDQEWHRQLQQCYGPDRVHLGPPQACEGHSAAWWEARGMSGLYLDRQ